MPHIESAANGKRKGVTEIEKILAGMIAEDMGADIFEIKPVKPCPKEYTPATEIANKYPPA